MELVASAAGLILAILAVVGVARGYTSPISAMAVGTALVAYGDIPTRATEPAAAQRHEDEHGLFSNSGVGAVLGGMSAAMLGMAALIGYAPIPILAIVAIVAGAAMLMSGRDAPQTSPALECSERRWVALLNTASAMAGLSALILGGIALAGVPSAIVLVGIAFAASGLALLGMGTAVQRMLRAVERPARLDAHPRTWP